MTSRRNMHALLEERQSYETVGTFSYGLHIDEDALRQLPPAVRDGIRADVRSAITKLPELLNQAAMVSQDEGGSFIQPRTPIEVQTSDRTYRLGISFEDFSDTAQYPIEELRHYLEEIVNTLQQTIAGALQGLIVPSADMTATQRAFSGIGIRRQPATASAGSPTGSKRQPGAVMRSDN